MTQEWSHLARSLELALDLARRRSNYAEIVRLLGVAQDECDRLGRSLPKEQLGDRVAGMRARGATVARIARELRLTVSVVRQILVERDRLAREERVRSAGGGPVTAESSVERLQLSVRVANIFWGRDITTVGQVTALRAVDLLRMHSFGRVCLADLERELALHGLRLAP